MQRPYEYHKHKHHQALPLHYHPAAKWLDKDELEESRRRHREKLMQYYKGQPKRAEFMPAPTNTLQSNDKNEYQLPPTLKKPEKLDADYKQQLRNSLVRNAFEDASQKVRCIGDVDAEDCEDEEEEVDDDNEDDDDDNDEEASEEEEGECDDEDEYEDDDDEENEDESECDDAPAIRLPTKITFKPPKRPQEASFNPQADASIVATPLTLSCNNAANQMSQSLQMQQKRNDCVKRTTTTGKSIEAFQHLQWSAKRKAIDSDDGDHNEDKDYFNNRSINTERKAPRLA